MTTHSSAQSQRWRLQGRSEKTSPVHAQGVLHATPTRAPKTARARRRAWHQSLLKPDARGVVQAAPKPSSKASHARLRAVHVSLLRPHAEKTSTHARGVLQAPIACPPQAPTVTTTRPRAAAITPEASTETRLTSQAPPSA